VEAVLAETDDRVTAAAVLARVGRPKKGEQDNSRKRESLGKGQTRDYTLARLRRDDPEMAARVKRDRPSMRFDVGNVGRDVGKAERRAPARWVDGSAMAEGTPPSWF
jgi:hypothetical protein